MTDPLLPTDAYDQVEAMKERDQRIKLIGQAINVDNELQNSPAWIYIRHRALMEWYEAVIALSTTPPQDQNRIRQLQAKAAIRDSIEGWIKNLMDTGKHYEDEIDKEAEKPVD